MPLSSSRAAFLFAVLAGFVLSPALVSAAVFLDVPQTHENFDAINHVRVEGIVQGYPDGTFRPDAYINRVEFTKIIIASGFTQAQRNDCDQKRFAFPDTGLNEWYISYVCLAAHHKIIQGYPDGLFHPTANIKFVEAAKIIALVDHFYVNGVRTDADPFPPAGDPDRWFEPYVRYLAGAGAIPWSFEYYDQPVTRGQMAEMIYRLQTDRADLPSRSYEEIMGMPSSTEKRQYNQTYGFSFLLPVGTQKRRSLIRSESEEAYDLPFERGTTLLGKFLSIDVRPLTGACSDPNLRGVDNAIPVEINRMTFTKEQVGDSAAGQRYDTTSFSTAHGDLCVTFSFDLHSSDVNDDPAYDPGRETAVFEEVLWSLRFE